MDAKKYYQLDLHVHTPASDDYRGSKKDEEYIRILKSAKKSETDMICITDHLSIKGYERLMYNKEEAKNVYKFLSNRNDAEPKFLESIQEEIDLFSTIHILMGVEIKITPGIHFILVFSENVKPDEVENFLNQV